MESALKLYRNEDDSHYYDNSLSVLNKSELRSINGGSPKAIAGWKAIAILGLGTVAVAALAIGATIVVYKGVEYLITE